MAAHLNLFGIVGSGICLVQFLLFAMLFVIVIEPAFCVRTGNARRIFVQKFGKMVDRDNGPEKLPHFTFSQEANWVLSDLFTHYPPGDGRSWDMIGENNDGADSRRQNKDDIFARPSMSKAEIAKRLQTLGSNTTADNLKQVCFFFGPFNIEDLILY